MVDADSRYRLRLVVLGTYAVEGDVVEGPEFMQAQQNSCPLVKDEDLACCAICGHLECVLQPMHPLIDGLPEMMHVQASALPRGAPERSALPLLITE
ncbi:hypothetical protein N9F34_01645 [Alphaproteobacteria bacterium]|nr:hypothetical protein [Alphaproteobacteria bacterium]